MLKKRLIATLILKNGILVQSIGFKRFLPIGNPIYTLELISKWDIDEIVILDIDCTVQNKSFNLLKLQEYARHSSVPLTVGGGIKSLTDVKKIISKGADKVLISSVIFTNINLIKKISEYFGSQCVVVCLDIKKENGKYYIFKKNGKIKTNYDLKKTIDKIGMLGAGEIMINSIDRDGKKKGFDINLIKFVASITNLPVIALGGAGKYSDFIEPFKRTKVSALAAGNIFHFTEHSTIIAKANMLKKGIDVRVNSDAIYKLRNFDDTGRVIPQSYSKLSKLILKPYNFKKSK